MYQTIPGRRQIESCYQKSVTKTRNVQLFLRTFGPSRRHLKIKHDRLLTSFEILLKLVFSKDEGSISKQIQCPKILFYFAKLTSFVY